MKLRRMLFVNLLLFVIGLLLLNANGALYSFIHFPYAQSAFYVYDFLVIYIVSILLCTGCILLLLLYQSRKSKKGIDTKILLYETSMFWGLLIINTFYYLYLSLITPYDTTIYFDVYPTHIYAVVLYCIQILLLGYLFIIAIKKIVQYKQV